MTPPDSMQPGDDDLIKRYRRASAEQPSLVSEAVRSRILQQARRAAALQADSQPPAGASLARGGRWRRLPAYGALAAVLAVALMALPHLRELQPASTGAMPVATPITPTPSSDAPLAPAMAPPAPQQPDQLAPAPPARAPHAASAAPEPAASEQQTAAAPAAAAPAAVSGDAAARLRSVPNESSGSDALFASVARADLLHSELLLQAGAVVDGRDDLGRTPLMLATQRGQLLMVRLLLQHGADPNALDARGVSVLQRAQASHRTDIEAALRGAGAH